MEKIKLDADQQKAVAHFEGPALVAGPCSGKTTVIKERILHLIHEYKVDPKQILAIAFTNAAVEELESILTELNSNHGCPTIRTLHGFGKDIITENYERAGFSEFPVRCTERIDEIIKNERKDSTPSVVIYKIESKSTGRCYIGQTDTPDRRRKQHFDHSSNDRLRQAIRSEGETQFSFKIIERVPRHLANCREAHWIRCYRNREGVFNREDPLRVQYINQLILKMFCQHFDIPYEESLDTRPDFENLRHRFNDIKGTVMQAKRKVTTGLFDPTMLEDPVAQAFARKYETLKTEANAVDFEDMIIHAANLLETCPDLRQTYRDTYPYLLVDEFQDRSPIDFRLINLFSRNLFAVGDLEYQIKKELQGVSQRAPEILKLKFEKQVKKELTAILKQADELNRLWGDIAEAEKASKQMKRDLPKQLKVANENLFADLLPVLDEFESQIKKLPAITESNNGLDNLTVFPESVQRTHAQLLNLLKTHELKPIETIGEVFNLTYHEKTSLDIYSDEVPAGTIAREERRGYLLKNQVIRKAEVVVSKGPEFFPREKLDWIVGRYLDRLTSEFRSLDQLNNVNEKFVKRAMVQYLTEQDDESLRKIHAFACINERPDGSPAGYCVGLEKTHLCTDDVFRDFWRKMWEVIKALDENIKQANTLLSQDFAQPVRFVTYAGMRDLSKIEMLKDDIKGLNPRGEKIQLSKLDVLFAFPKGDMETLKSHIKRNPTIANQKLQPIELISDQCHIADDILKPLMIKRDTMESDNREDSTVRLVTRSGYVLNGHLSDFDEDFLYMDINNKVVIVYRTGILEFKNLIWHEITKAYKNRDPIEGYVTKRIKDGFQVKFGLLHGFLPKSQVELNTVQNLDSYVGETFKMKVTKLNKTNNNIVLSRRAWLEERRTKLLNTLEEGQHVTGVVKNITNSGAFVDLGGIGGLLYKSEMAWKRISHPSQVVSVGEEVEVKVIEFDQENGKISLSLKQMTSDPWENVKDKYPIGSKVSGVVVNIVDYGAFVQLEEGIVGLIHVSEMPLILNNVSPLDLLNKDDELEVTVIKISKDSKRISLSIK